MKERKKLMAKKQELEELINSKRETFSIPLMEASDELSFYDQHPADVASDLWEREKDAGILELLELELEKVDQALARHDSGQYGICELCGQAIEAQRLDTLVNTTRCAKCARSVEENAQVSPEIIADHSMADRGESFQVAGYEFYEE